VHAKMAPLDGGGREAVVQSSFWTDYPLAKRQDWEGPDAESVVPKEVAGFCASLSGEEIRELNRCDLFTPVLPSVSVYHEQSGEATLCGREMERNDLLVELARVDRRELKRNISVYGCGVNYARDNFLAASRAFRSVFPSGNQLSKLATSSFLRTADKFSFPETRDRPGVFICHPGFESNAAAVNARVVTTGVAFLEDPPEDLIYYDQGGYDDGLKFGKADVEWLAARYEDGYDLVTKWDMKYSPPFPVAGYRKMRPHNDEIVLLVLHGQGETFDLEVHRERQRYFNFLRDEMIIFRDYPLELDKLQTWHDPKNCMVPPIIRGRKPRHRIRFDNGSGRKLYDKLCKELGPHPPPMYHMDITVVPPYAFVDLQPHTHDEVNFFLNLLVKGKPEFDELVGWYHN
jgi:hypothetical protein